MAHEHYFKGVEHLTEIDVYRVCDLFKVDDSSGATQHAIKKLLLPGLRGAGKSTLQDLKEARDSINRKMAMLEEDELRDQLRADLAAVGVPVAPEPKAIPPFYEASRFVLKLMPTVHFDSTLDEQGSILYGPQCFFWVNGSWDHMPACIHSQAQVIWEEVVDGAVGFTRSPAEFVPWAKINRFRLARPNEGGWQKNVGVTPSEISEHAQVEILDHERDHSISKIRTSTRSSVSWHHRFEPTGPYSVSRWRRPLATIKGE